MLRTTLFTPINVYRKLVWIEHIITHYIYVWVQNKNDLLFKCMVIVIYRYIINTSFHSSSWFNIPSFEQMIPWTPNSTQFNLTRISQGLWVNVANNNYLGV